MGAIFYYIPGRVALGDQDYTALGLGHLAGTSPHVGVVMGGPDNGNGAIFVPRPRGGTLNIDASLVKYFGPNHEQHAQHWQKCDGGRYWIGWFKRDRPGPADIARQRRYSGEDVVLGDGNTWRVPKISALPKTYGLDQDGDMTAIPSPDHEPQYNAAAALLQVMLGGESITNREMLDCIATCMTVNYRLSYWELCALGLVSEENLADIVGAICGLRVSVQALEDAAEALKKNSPAETSDGTNSAHGETE